MMLENQLAHNRVKVEFIKLDGTYRIMICTKSPELIGDNMPISTSTETKLVNESIIKVFDLEKTAWRTIRKDRIRQWQLDSNN